MLRKNIVAPRRRDRRSTARHRSSTCPLPACRPVRHRGIRPLTIAGGSIIRTLSLLRIVGYRYTDGTYFGGSNDDNCPYQRALNTNGECKSWGNPMSEMYYEGLRYFAGQTAPTAAFQGDDSSLIAKLATATWPSNRNTVLSTKNYCAPLNVLVVNGAVSTNENDSQIGSVTFMENAASATAKSLTNGIGAVWGLTGTYFFGHADGAGSGSSGYDICSGKSLTGLGEALGICPEGPTLNGSYLMAGLAYHAHTNKVRTDITVPASAARLKRTPLQVDTYGVSIAGGIPRIPVKFKGETQSRVVIQPAYRLTQRDLRRRRRPGRCPDHSPDRRGRPIVRNQIMVSWEDSEAGGDYDMDVWGIISYEMDTVDQPDHGHDRHDLQGDRQSAGLRLRHQRHRSGRPPFPQRHLRLRLHRPDARRSALPAAPAGSTRQRRLRELRGRRRADARRPTSLSTTPPAKSLEDPLYYASLFGGFEDTNSDRMPTPEQRRRRRDPAVGVRQARQRDRRRHARRHTRQLLPRRQPARPRDSDSSAPSS